MILITQIYFFRIQKVLSGKKVNILDVLLKKSSNKGIGHILGSVAVQIGLIDVLNLLEIKPTNKLTYSFGELLSAYYDGSVSLKETIDYAFVTDKALDEVNKTLENNNNNYEVRCK